MNNMQGSASVADFDGRILGRQMVTYAKGLLARIDEGQNALLTTEFTDPERRTWAFGPVRREGLRLDLLSEEQFGLLEALLDTALSEEGMAAWHEIRELESVLRKLESTPERVAEHRDPNLYWLRIYGTPSASERWSWRFEGHHVALHVTCNPDAIPTVTPFFLGANPLFTDEGPTSRVAAFTRLNEAYRSLLTTLDEKTAMAAAPELGGEGPDKRPGDIRMGPGKPDLPTPSGVRYTELTPAARNSVKALINSYLGLLEPGLRTHGITEVNVESARFARWAGSEIGEARTWSIQTDTFALELATTDGPHHVHALLRDVTQDFGGASSKK